MATTQVRFTTEITVDGLQVYIDVPMNSKAWGYANCVFCPLGSIPTQAWLVVPKFTVDQLDPKTTHKITWRQLNTDQDDGSNVTVKELVFTNLYMVRCERVLHGGVDDPNAMFLVEFADARLLCANRSDSDVTFSNLRSYANQQDFLAGTDTYGTWVKLTERLWEQCEFLGDWPGFPGGFNPDDGDQPPQNSWFIGVSAYKALNAVLEQLDCALKHDPLAISANAYSIVQLGEDQTTPDNNATLKWDGQPVTINTTQAASTLVFYFPNHLKAYGQERDTELAQNWVLNDSCTRRTEDSGITGAKGKVVLWDDLPAVFDENNSLTNETDIETRISKRKARYTKRWGVTSRHRIHYGLLTDYLPGEQVRAVLWRNWNDTDNPLGGTCTEYLCKNDLVTEFKGNTSGATWFYSDKSKARENEQYSPFDLSQHTYPNYPRLPNIVQVHGTDGSPSPGDTVQPLAYNSVFLHKGRVKRFVNGAMATLDNCWILFIDAYDTIKGNLPAIQDEYYGPARLSGVATISGVMLPVYTIRKNTEDSGIVVFRLTTALSLNVGSTATANILQLSGGNYIIPPGSPPTITVIDGYAMNYGLWSGIVGARGMATRRADGKYDIIFMERSALILEFTASADRAGATDSFAATISNSYQQGDITASMVSGGGSAITVWDANRFFPNVLNGSKGLAIWNDKANRYDCLIAQQRALTATATISMSSGMEGPSSPVVDIQTFVVTSPSPFNVVPDPLPTTCRNPYSHRGMDGDTVELLWHQTLGQYVVIDVSKHDQDVLMDIRINAGNTQIEVKKATCALEYASNPAFANKIPLQACP
jgi:hypothetical protein